MINISPNSSGVAPSQEYQDEYGADESIFSMDQSLEPIKTRPPNNLTAFHPNSALPGRWWRFPQHERSQVWHKQINNKRDSFAIRDQSSSHLDAISSMDEFYETHDNLSRAPTYDDLSGAPTLDHFSNYNPLSSALDDFDPDVRPHMTEPLLPDGSPLDFSPIEQFRGQTNIFSATPLARVWEFNSVTDIHEYSILNILADEFENMDSPEGEAQPSLWSQFKKLTIGLTEDEYDLHYPWAKYCIRTLSREESADTT